MSTPGVGGGEGTMSSEELERLRNDRDRLQQEVERLEDRPGRRMRGRRIVAAVLVVLTVLALALAVPGTWVRRTVTNTDRYVATVGPLIDDPAVQEYVARTITASVFQALGVEEQLSQALQEKAPRLAFLAGPIATSVQGFVQDQVQKLVATDAFRTLWRAANYTAQSQIVALLNGGGDVLSTSNGQVVLNLLPLVNEALGTVSQLASDLLGRPVPIPTITAGEIPAEAIQKIEAATGIQLPSNFGQVALVSSSQLAAAQDAFGLANRLVIALVILFVLFLVAALWVSPRRRRTLIQIAAASAIVMVIERRVAIAESGNIIDQAKPENQAALRAVVDTLKGSLLSYTGWLLAIALIALLIAVLTGPYGWAVRLRDWVRDLFRAVVGATRGADRTAAADWTARHRDPLLLGGAAVFIVLLLGLNLSWGGFLVLVLLAAAYGGAVWRIAAVDAAGAEEASTPG